MIYLIYAKGTEYCKIGYSKNPKARLAALQTGMPYQLVMDCIIEGGHKLERELHQRFSEYQVRGEWFQYNNLIRDWFCFLYTYPSMTARDGKYSRYCNVKELNAFKLVVYLAGIEEQVVDEMHNIADINLEDFTAFVIDTCAPSFDKDVIVTDYTITRNQLHDYFFDFTSSRLNFRDIKVEYNEFSYE